MFVQAPSEVIPRTQQTIGANKTMIMIFVTARQLILLDVLPKGSKSNQQYIINYVFPFFKTENLNFRRRMVLATFWCTWIIQCVTMGQNRVKIRQVSHCTIAAPTQFAIPIMHQLTTPHGRGKKLPEPKLTGSRIRLILQILHPVASSCLAT
jgi:hypothetical protein